MPSNIQPFVNFLSVFVLTFVAAAVVEAVVAYLRHRTDRNPRETAANLVVYVLGRGWRDFIMRGIELAILSGVYAFAPRKLPTDMAALWWTLPLTVLVADFVYYWKHRTEHGVRVLWAFHSVHHSSEEYNFSTALRLPWFGAFISLLWYFPMALAGFSPLLIVLGRSLVLIYQFWIHTQTIGKLGWFDRVFNSPSNHRVHHGSNQIYLDRNHGGILILWDRMFGTYQAETETVRYGLTHNIETRNPLMINLREPLNIVKDVRAAATWSDRFHYVFGNPGWRPTA